MHTLREFGDFIGIPQGSATAAGFRDEGHTSLKMVGLLVTNSPRGASMASVSSALQNLQPIGLECRLVSSRSGEEPYQPVIRVSRSTGIVWRTVVHYLLDGEERSQGADLGSAGGEFSQGTQLGHGSWQLVVTRAGIADTGFVSLRRALDPIDVSPHPKSTRETPTKPPPTKRPPQPTVTCGVESVDQPDFGGLQKIRIFGGGFVGGEPIDVLQETQLQTTTTADTFGGYSVTESLVTSVPPQEHTFHALGKNSGRVSNNAGISV